MRQLALDLGERSYNIYIEGGLLKNADLIESYCGGDNVLIFSNEVVAPIYLELLKNSLPNKQVSTFLIPDGESQKNLANFAAVIDCLIEKGFRRNDTLIALGGGVVGDLGGFVAASYQRGMGFVQMPTSLLAQVDSSVGGKTAVNHPQGKNMIGAFYQPKAVIIDTLSINTLPEREYISGFGEIVKYAMLGSNKLKQLLLTNVDAIKSRDKDLLAEIIYLSCQQKALVVAADEKETGKRALLNLGHTFGHAIERLTNYQTYLHGEAVSIGTVMAINLSLAKGLIENSIADEYQQLMLRLGLPVSIKQSLSVDDFLSVMKLDKKNLNSKYRLVLPTNQDCLLVEEDNLALIQQSIAKQLN